MTSRTSSLNRSKARAPRTRSTTTAPTTTADLIKDCYGKYVNIEFGKSLLFDPDNTWIIATFLFCCEIVINSFVIIYRPYTEIDWEAYMEEVGGFLNGTLDYQFLKGGTGPLVYPAGFVYFFSVLYFATGKGTNVAGAQWIYGVFYLVMIYQVFRLYCRSRKVPPYALLFLTFTSYRVHSIFVLRLFNDPIAIILTYIAINAFMDGRWTLGSLTYSLAVSIKMNVLLYAPALLTIYLTQLNVFDAVVQLAVCGVLQFSLALPFLMVNPWSYMSRSFDLGRVFFFEWTVNWKFLPEEIFLNRWFHLGLLGLHVIVLLSFVPSWLRYLRSYFNLERFTTQPGGETPMLIRNQLFLFPLFVSNFIGICFSRSLHYQFYIWYYHTIPYLLWSTNYSVRTKLCLFGVIELCWNVFPATPASSLALVSCHLLILGGLWQYSKPQRDWSKVQFKNR